MDTHLAIASAIAQREADSGLGIEAAARSCKLDFLPLFRERYDMVIPGPVYQSDLVAPLLRMISSKEFTRIVNKVDGYDTSQTGTTTFIT
jgi:putative molybdopterin biosynthesis protein